MSDDPKTATDEMTLRAEALIEKRNFHLAEEQHHLAAAATHRNNADKCNAMALDYQRVIDLSRSVAQRAERERQVGAGLAALPEAMGAAINEAASKATRKRK